MEKIHLQEISFLTFFLYFRSNKVYSNKVDISNTFSSKSDINKDFIPI